MPDDKEKIPDGHSLLRRIHPTFLVENKRVPGRRRLSSGAFRDPNMSVDVEELLQEAAKDWHFTLQNFPDFALVRFSAGFARKQGQAVSHEPEADNDAHAVVRGSKRGGIPDAFRDGSGWVQKPDDVD